MYVEDWIPNSKAPQMCTNTDKLSTSFWVHSAAESLSSWTSGEHAHTHEGDDITDSYNSYTPVIFRGFVTIWNIHSLFYSCSFSNDWIWRKRLLMPACMMRCCNADCGHWLNHLTAWCWSWGCLSWKLLSPFMEQKKKKKSWTQCSSSANTTKAFREFSRLWWKYHLWNIYPL